MKYPTTVIQAIRDGHCVVCSANDMAQLESDLTTEEQNQLASAVNGRQVGTYDHYVAWLSHLRTPTVRRYDELRVCTSEGVYLCELKTRAGSIQTAINNALGIES